VKEGSAKIGEGVFAHPVSHPEDVRRRAVGTDLLVNRVCKHQSVGYHVFVIDMGPQSFEELARLTSGIRQGEDGLIAQQRLRDEWSER
jgi:hypothetical protein